MNKVFIATIIAIILPLTAYAAPGEEQRSRGSHVERIQKIAKKLDLTKEQESKLAIILKEQHQKHKALKKQTHEKMKQLLTGEQMEKMNSRFVSAI